MKKNLLISILFAMLAISSFQLKAQNELSKNYLSFGFERQAFSTLPFTGAILYEKDYGYYDFFNLSFTHVFNKRFRLEFSGNFNIVASRYFEYNSGIKYSYSQIAFQPIMRPYFTFAKTKYVDFAAYGGVGADLRKGNIHDVLTGENFKYEDAKMIYEFGFSFTEKLTSLNATINLGVVGVGKSNFVSTGIKVKLSDLSSKK